MSDKPDPPPFIIAQCESDLVARGVTPWPGSIVDYCPHCKVAVRLSPKSQKTIKNRNATFACPACTETKILSELAKSGEIITFGASNEADMKRFTDMCARAGHDTLPLGTYRADVCIPCACGNHDQCEGQGCGCGPCQIDGPVAGL